METGGAVTPLIDTVDISSQWFWTIVLIGFWLLIVVIAFKATEEIDTPIHIAFSLVFPLLILIGIIWWLDIIRWIVAVILALVILGFVLALWKVPRSGLWPGWLVGAIIVAAALVFSTVPLWPIESTEWLWFTVPLGAPAVVASLIGSLILRHRRIVRREQDKVARDKEKKKTEALRVQENDRLRIEVRRRSIKAAEAEAKKIANNQDIESGKIKTKHQLSRMDRVLKKLWHRVHGKAGHGISLVHLAQLSNLSVEQTYVAVCMLENWAAVTTNRDSDRERWTDLNVYLNQKGADAVVERRETIMKKTEFNIGKKSSIGQMGEHLNGKLSIESVGNNNYVAHNEFETGLSESSLNAVLESIQNLRMQLVESYQIEALDTQVEELKTAKDDSAKRSALERVKAVVLALGPLAKPVLDIVNDILKTMNPPA